jgi:hypothetical protein
VRWPASFYFPLKRRESEGTPYVAPIANLKVARSLALDDNFAVPPAQFDPSNVAARAVNLIGDWSRAGGSREPCIAKT